MIAAHALEHTIAFTEGELLVQSRRRERRVVEFQVELGCGGSCCSRDVLLTLCRGIAASSAKESNEAIHDRGREDDEGKEW